MTDTELRFVLYVPEGFEGSTVDVVDALRRGRAVLVEEEHRWVQSSWFQNEHPEVDIQDPFCNNWRVCAEGAVLIVTVGLHNQDLIMDNDTDCPWNILSDFVEPDKDEDGEVDEDGVPYGIDPELWNASDPVQRGLYLKGIEQLRETGERAYEAEHGYRPEYEHAHSYNDVVLQTRDEVIAWFDRAIADAEMDAA